MLVPLAHGALGFWDELIPVLLVGGFAAILVVTGLLSRRNESKLDEQLEQSQNPVPVESANAQPDHYRLD